MRKVLVSNATGEQAKQQLALALPTFQWYADRYGYELHIGEDTGQDRGGAWGKIRLLQNLQDDYDLMLWVDSDAMFTDISSDVAELIEPDCFQALLMEQHQTRWNPNTGVWLLRGKNPDTRVFLQEVWDTGNVPGWELWWEQGAVLKLMGWKTGTGRTKLAQWSPYLPKTSWLSPEWNRQPGLYPGIHARINHWGGGPSEAKRRIQEMTEVLQKLRDAGLPY